jgi:hypothetical protein
MNDILELRAYLDEVKGTYDDLRETQRALNSPTFSCRDAFPKTIEEPKTQADIVRFLSEKSQRDVDTKINVLVNAIDRLRTAAQTITLQAEYHLRSGNVSGIEDADIQASDNLFEASLNLKTSMNEDGLLTPEAFIELSGAFEAAASQVSDAKNRILGQDVMCLSAKDILSQLRQSRIIFGALAVEASILKMSEVSHSQVMCLQLERAIVKKIIPDSDDVREQTQFYRALSNRMMAEVKGEFEKLESFMAAIGKFDFRVNMAVKPTSDGYMPVPLSLLA